MIYDGMTALWLTVLSEWRDTSSVGRGREAEVQYFLRHVRLVHEEGSQVLLVPHVGPHGGHLGQVAQSLAYHRRRPRSLLALLSGHLLIKQDIFLCMPWRNFDPAFEKATSGFFLGELTFR